MTPAKRQLHVLGRIGAFAAYLVVLYGLLVFLSGRWIPTNGEQDLWFVCAVGFLAYSLFDTPFFVPPSQVVASGVPSVLLLLSIDLRAVGILQQPLEWFRWISVGAAVTTVVSASLAVALRDTDPVEHPTRGLLRGLAQRIAVRLGDGGVMFTPPALISIIGYHQASAVDLLWLALIWTVLVCLRPIELALEVVRDLSAAGGDAGQVVRVGEIRRIDSPNIMRVTLAPQAAWRSDELQIGCLPDNRQVDVLPLFVQAQSGELVGTGLVVGDAKSLLREALPGGVYRPPSAASKSDALERLAKGPGCDLAGFVIEESRIGAIQFEVAGLAELGAGRVVFCNQARGRVYYQILDARTREESFEQNPRGTHIGTAGQLGVMSDGRFVRYDWLPEMNAPVFLPPVGNGGAGLKPPKDAFEIGRLPQFNAGVHARLKDLVGYHTAILGVTGTGKTELVFDLIRRAHQEGTKVFCVDFTGEYRPRLADLAPSNLDFGADKMTQLQDLVAAIETGAYGAGEEKKRLEKWETGARSDVRASVAAFLDAQGPAVGLFELPDIANTRATLRATELYLSAIFDWARANRKKRSILVVLEEAHTVIPETGLYGGFDKGETPAVVGRMSQIALQGRKYGVGLLLVSQRTALVSKTLLSQCSTVIAFALHDRTSLEYLQSVFGSEHVQALPRLPFRHAVAYGKGILSDSPIVIELPEDPKKREASEKLTVSAE